jgi:hypothetical protein
MSYRYDKYCDMCSVTTEIIEHGPYHIHTSQHGLCTGLNVSDTYVDQEPQAVT